MTDGGRVHRHLRPIFPEAVLSVEARWMKRFRGAFAVAFLAGLLTGCGEDQPNQPASGSDLTPDFAAKSADMMKSANAGMNPKAAKSANAPAK
jgi:hypothetical protein